jgi:hypothetical protein
MALVTDLVEHYQQAIERGELAPEDVPTASALMEEWGCGRGAARQTRKLLVSCGVVRSRNATLSLGPISDMDMAFRFFPKVEPRNEDGCLLWNAGTTGSGYGKFKLNGRDVQAHRVAYEYRHGPVPVGLLLDHVFDRGCRSILCVNVEHLEPITHAENIRRGYAAKRWKAGIRVTTELDTDD